MDISLLYSYREYLNVVWTTLACIVRSRVMLCDISTSCVQSHVISCNLVRAEFQERLVRPPEMLADPSIVLGFPVQTEVFDECREIHN